MDRLKDAALLAARILMSSIFLMSGLFKVTNFGGTVEAMEAHGMPIAPLFLLGAIFLELGGGLSVLVGYFTRGGAVALIIFLIPTTLIFHAFWSLPAETPEQLETFQIEMGNFMKNFVIMGGLLALMVAGSGRWSIDATRAPLEGRC